MSNLANIKECSTKWAKSNFGCIRYRKQNYLNNLANTQRLFEPNPSRSLLHKGAVFYKCHKKWSKLEKAYWAQRVNGYYLVI